MEIFNSIKKWPGIDQLNNVETEQDQKAEVDKLKEQCLFAKEFDVEKIVIKKIEMEKLIEALKFGCNKETGREEGQKFKKILENELNRKGIPQYLISKRDKKFELNEQQERILKEQKFHKELQKKGLDFFNLDKIGGCTSIKILKKNIIMDEEKLDEYRLNYNLNNMAKKNKMHVLR
ncbi:unnamed protein product [Paramecium pentaurelia]|uniref:Uncharacterized protein n=1 Tax=Paramecium pentaurelia TaxID=43138 RepID=A0A8S1SKZ0_9CILI|nr:unnamed protein product [Paramecium pentaurelia]